MTAYLVKVLIGATIGFCISMGFGELFKVWLFKRDGYKIGKKGRKEAVSWIMDHAMKGEPLKMTGSGKVALLWTRDGEQLHLVGNLEQMTRKWADKDYSEDHTITSDEAIPMVRKSKFIKIDHMGDLKFS